MTKKNPTPDEMRKALTEVRAGLREMHSELKQLIEYLETKYGRPPAAPSGS